MWSNKYSVRAVDLEISQLLFLRYKKLMDTVSRNGGRNKNEKETINDGRSIYSRCYSGNRP